MIKYVKLKKLIIITSCNLQRSAMEKKNYKTNES